MSVGIALAIAIIPILISLYALRVSLRTKAQLQVTQQDIANKKKQEDEDLKWAERFEELSSRLLRINPRIQVQEPGLKTPTWIYTTMYPDPKFRVDIENLIVNMDPYGVVFLPRTPEPHQLRSKRMRETIAKAETLMAQFISAHPFCEQHLVGK